MHVFIAGIMQGSRHDHLIDSQDYRDRISKALQAQVPGVKISDPFALHPGSVDYGPELVRETFESLTSLAGEADVLIAFLPKASMGTQPMEVVSEVVGIYGRALWGREEQVRFRPAGASGQLLPRLS